MSSLVCQCQRAKTIRETEFGKSGHLWATLAHSWHHLLGKLDGSYYGCFLTETWILLPFKQQTGDHAWTGIFSKLRENGLSWHRYKSESENVCPDLKRCFNSAQSSSFLLMKHKFRFLFLGLGAIAALLLTLLPVSARSQLTEQSKLAIDGVGPVRVGMTIAQAESSAGVRLVEKGGRAGSGGCYYVRPQLGPANLGFMVISDREDNRIVRDKDQIARVDVWRNGRITTVSGAKNGDTEARIKALYPGKIRVSPHKYNRNGRYLTYTPQDPEDRNYRLIFETDGKKVTQFRSGRLPEVEYVEGCA